MKTILNLIQANAEITNLKKELEASRASVEQMNASVEELKSSHATELEQIKEAHEVALNDANAKVELLTEANELLEKQQKSASEQAVQVLASVGVEQPVEESAHEPKVEKSIEEMWADYKAIGDAKERRAFYSENIKPRL